VTAPAVAAPAAALADKRAQVQQLLGDIFRLAEWPARVELKDGADGGIAVAVHFEGDVPGVTAGKKSYLVDSLQFLVNKVVNRPGAEKRWVTLGVGGFPEPKASAPPPQASAPQQKAQPKPQPSAPKQPKASTPKAAAPREEEADVALSPEWEALGKLLAGKSAKHGRPYAVMSLSSAERAQLVKAASGALGVRVKVEGEGHFRRVALTPDKVVPMPRKMQFPDDDEDDDEG
jgi:predicted RNA-binding protein Jag